MNNCSAYRGFVLHAATHRSQLPGLGACGIRGCTWGKRDRAAAESRCVELHPWLCRAPLAGRRAIEEALASAKGAASVS